MDQIKIINQCKTILVAHYGTALANVVLFGSTARNQADEASDIDLLVLLKGDFNFFTELFVITDILYPVQLDSDRLISAKPVRLDDYEAGSIRLFRFAKKEGILI
ncbi:MAG: nucleotidyltransferase domain-containing protein [Chitinivibrionales bacterium]|nr:nucleotidyltransferase domain-containing protein [Chitinivibrionales bacterium]